MVASASIQTVTKAENEPCRVLVVDDSAIVRGIYSRWLEAEKDMRVVATAVNGQNALLMVGSHELDVVILDIEMPGMDGLEALPYILRTAPHLQVIIVSTISLRNAEVSLRALELGAADYVPKPRATRDLTSDQDFKNEFLEKIRLLSARSRNLRKYGTPSRQVLLDDAAPAPLKKIIQRPLATAVTPSLLAIGASTGGPQAIFNLLCKLKRPFPVPILVTQHMPAAFTPILALHIQRLTEFTAKEAQDGEIFESDRVYVAPGDHHLEVIRDGDSLKAHLSTAPAENFCRPAVDPMFRSIAKAVGKRALCAVLTGMGKDGAGGAHDIADAGGIILAQNEESCVVYGMPRAVTEAGLTNYTGDIDSISTKINELCFRSDR